MPDSSHSRQSLIVVLSEISIRIMNSFSARFDRQRKLIFLTCSGFGRRNILSRDQFFLSLISMLHPGCVLSSEMVIDWEIHKNAFIFSAQERVFSVFALLHFLRFQNSGLCVRELYTHRKVKNLLFNMWTVVASHFRFNLLIALLLMNFELYTQGSYLTTHGSKFIPR